jgi:cytochrome d ubiquinol oxidase subunit I
MVAIGGALALLALWSVWLTARRLALAEARMFLRALVVATPLGFIAVEAGWVVTEVGRQPWIIANLMRTSEAVTSVQVLTATFTAFTVLYVLLSAVVVVVLRRLVLEAPA